MRGIAVFVLIVSGLVAQSRTPAPAVEVLPHPCKVDMVQGAALCATYPVWEDRDRKAGRRIGLNIVIVPALEPDKASEPIFAFNGGPGGSATEMAPGLAAIGGWRAHHDIVLVDQRGTGRSNPLDCDLYGDPPDVQKLVQNAFPVEAVRACRQKLEKVADLRHPYAPARARSAAPGRGPRRHRPHAARGRAGCKGSSSSTGATPSSTAERTLSGCRRKPVLLLSGGRDAVTPPEFAVRAAKYMTNSLQVVFPESSHGNFGRCGWNIEADFFDRGSVKGLDVSCAAAQPPLKFLIQ